MKITCLVNNFSKNKDLIDEHGLSFYIEKDTKKILFDTGLGKALFYNAKILNIDLKDIDYVILSHAHNDHTGRLNEFLKINSRAKVIAHKEIFIEKYSKRTGEMRFIGLSKDDLDLARFQFVENTYKLSENISLYGNLLEYDEAREKNHFVKIDADNQYYDFHLSAKSAAIDKADKQTAPTSDRNGKKRIGIPDVGAYEY